MGFYVVGKGVNNGGNVQSISISNVTLAAGASIMVGVSHSPETIQSVTWKGLALAKDAEALNTGNVQVSIWSLHNVSADIGDVVVTFAASVLKVCISALSIRPDEPSAYLDQIATGTGNSGVPASGTTASLEYVGELGIGVLAMNHASGYGNWDSPAVAVQAGYHSTSLQIRHGVLSCGDSTSGISMSLSGMGSGQWAIAVTTYHEGAKRIRSDGLLEHKLFKASQARVDATLEHKLFTAKQARVDGTLEHKVWTAKQVRVDGTMRHILYLKSINEVRDDGILRHLLFTRKGVRVDGTLRHIVYKLPSLEDIWGGFI